MSDILRFLLFKTRFKQVLHAAIPKCNVITMAKIIQVTKCQSQKLINVVLSFVIIH